MIKRLLSIKYYKYSKKFKLLYHLNFWIYFIINSFFALFKKKNRIQIHQCSKNPEHIKRINYYNKLNRNFKITSGFSLSQIPKFKYNSAYYYDLYKILFKFPPKIIFNYILGDVKYVPSIPSFVKSRPLNCDNEKSILLPLNTWRHFKFINDEIPYDKKLSKIVWRGAAYQENRILFLKKNFYHPFCDIGCTAPNKLNIPFKKKFMPIEEQLKYKFIFSIEGNDVASNLKWILNSNSLCFMQKPKNETWAMEGLLKSGIHYVEINKNFSNLKSKYNYYLNHPNEAKRIIQNANKFIEQIKDESLQINIAIGVVQKYLKLSNQYE